MWQRASLPGNAGDGGDRHFGRATHGNPPGRCHGAHVHPQHLHGVPGGHASTVPSVWPLKQTLRTAALSTSDQPTGVWMVDGERAPRQRPDMSLTVRNRTRPANDGGSAHSRAGRTGRAITGSRGASVCRSGKARRVIPGPDLLANEVLPAEEKPAAGSGEGCRENPQV